MKTSMSMINRILSAVSAGVLIVMMVHIVLNALSRYFANAPMVNTNELAQYWYLPVVVLLGIPAAQLQHEHITATLLVDRMNAGNARAFRLFAYGLGIVMCGLWVWFGTEQALGRFAVRSTAGLTDLPAWPVYFLVPISFALLALIYISEAAVDLSRRTPDFAADHGAIA